MRRSSLNLLLDTVAAVLLTAMVATGYVLAFALPPGTNRTHWLWGLLRHEWGAVHGWISLALLAVLGVHVALHWPWLLAGLSRRLGLETWAARRPRLAGLALLAVAAAPLTALAVAAHLSVRPLDTPLHPPAGDRPARDAAAAADARAAAVLAERCAACHGARDAAGGVRADSPQALAAAQRGVRWVVPGEPDASPLLDVVGAPAPGRPISAKHRLAPDEVGILRDWIAALD